MTKIIFEDKCYKCEKQIEIEAEDINLFCDECDRNIKEEINQDSIKETMKELAMDSYWWMDKENYVGFKSERERIYFLNGVREGVQHSLWVLREYLEIEEQDEFWEELCNKMPKLKYPENKND